jgi:hypothetical protein
VLLHLHVEGPTALWCRWIFPARACIGAAIAPRAAARRSRRTWRPPCCCARDGRSSLPSARADAARSRCAARAPFSPKGLDRGGRGAGARSRVFRLSPAGAVTMRRCGSGCARRRARGARRTPRRCILGSDIDAEAVRMSIANGESAGVADWLHVEKRALSEVVPPKRHRAGRDQSALRRAHRRGVGLPAVFRARRVLRERFQGWQAAILTGQSAAGAQSRHVCQAHASVFNGTIECRLLRFDLNEASEQRPAEAVRADWSSRPGAQMFANRLRKNLRAWSRGPSASTSIASASTTRTCRNMPSPSICTAARRGTSMCRNMRRRRP